MCHTERKWVENLTLGLPFFFFNSMSSQTVLDKWPPSVNCNGNRGSEFVSCKYLDLQKAL
jgi:hypothetical protein